MTKHHGHDTELKVSRNARICWNCKEPASFRFFCLDCWRMAIVTAALIGGGGETVHQLIQRFIGLAE